FGDQKDLARECILQPIRLLDVCRMEDEEIKQHNLFGLSEFAFKYKETQHFKEFLSIFLPWVDEVVFDVGQQYINSLSYYVLYVFKNGSKEQYIKATNRYLSELSKGGSMTIAEQLIEEGMQKGMQQGEQKGMQKGEQKGMQKGIQQGEQSGLRKGLRQARQQIAVVLLKRQASEEAVSEITGLSLEEVQTLKKDLIDI
ncbi:MAG: hypothetical protein KDH94_02955, partial [Coxiellaceae bacterium]|nr:hypothetical protein [Coxiellaceae bacterium]